MKIYMQKDFRKFLASMVKSQQIKMVIHKNKIRFKYNEQILENADIEFLYLVHKKSSQ